MSRTFVPITTDNGFFHREATLDNKTHLGTLKFYYPQDSPPIQKTMNPSCPYDQHFNVDITTEKSFNWRKGKG